MAKRSEIAVGQVWALNYKTDPLVLAYRDWTHPVQIESTTPVKAKRWAANVWDEWPGGRDVLVRNVRKDGTLDEVWAVPMSSLRMLWADWEVAKAEQDKKIEAQDAAIQKRIEHFNNVEKPALDKCVALLSQKLDINRHKCPFNYEEALRLIAVLEALPNPEAKDQELKLVQSA